MLYYTTGGLLWSMGSLSTSLWLKGIIWVLMGWARILSIFVPHWSTLSSNLLYCYCKDYGASICFIDRIDSRIDLALLSIITILSNVFQIVSSACKDEITGNSGWVKIVIMSVAAYLRKLFSNTLKKALH